MTQEQLDDFFDRIDQVNPDLKARFGKMNVHQMIPHLTDQIRMLLKTKVAEGPVELSGQEAIERARKGISVPTPPGFGQVELEGTSPTTLEEDIQTLKEHLIKFFELDESFDYGDHPYFGVLNRKQWTDMVVYHLHHHLHQFGV